ncbi:MAG TPA: aminotransferase class V-fold PLP-dependent enzyme [Sandaracinaceae bacterium LLY-WYZ-13_1]|nr:aminotransferase class V-fold PLP-dependent enzyme [Sandaracinaceae bacterium LLY-WYZ-13_1]
MTVYLNHAGTSWPKPAPVREAVRAALEGDPAGWDGCFEAGHRAVAEWLNAPPARVRLTPGCTSALGAAVAELPWEAGDRVVTSGFEHRALTRPVEALRARGVENVVVPPDGDAPLDLAALERALAEGRVRLVALSAASNVTGALLPWEAVIERAHAHGARVLLDAAQVAGWIPLDVRATGVDLLAFAGHKGPQAPWGIGGLYVAPDLPSPGYCDTGSVDRAALAGLAAGLAWLEARPGRLAAARARIERLARATEALPGVRLHGPRAPEARVPTLALSHATIAPATLAARLSARGVVASGGRQCAAAAHRTLGTDAGGGVLRLSAGAVSTDRDVDRAADALRDALSEPPRERR